MPVAPVPRKFNSFPVGILMSSPAASPVRGHDLRTPLTPTVRSPIPEERCTLKNRASLQYCELGELADGLCIKQAPRVGGSTNESSPGNEELGTMPVSAAALISTVST